MLSRDHTLKGEKNFEEVQKKGKVFNRKISHWSYGQFRNLLIYKAQARGKQVILVDPHYTSQQCSCCGFVAKENRNKGDFHCTFCGFYSSADLNASKNISQMGQHIFEQVAVNQPNISSDEAKARISELRPSLEVIFQAKKNASSALL